MVYRQIVWLPFNLIYFGLIYEHVLYVCFRATGDIWLVTSGKEMQRNIQQNCLKSVNGADS